MPSAPSASRPRATASPAASESPAGARLVARKRHSSEKVRLSPGAEIQLRPRRPRPALWRAATRTLPDGAPASARRISWVLVESHSAIASTSKRQARSPKAKATRPGSMGEELERVLTFSPDECSDRLSLILRGFRIVEAEFLDLAGDRVAADAEQLRRLDAPPAGGGQRAANQGGLEGAGQDLEHLAGPGDDQAIRFAGKCREPVGGLGVGRLVAEFGGQVGGIDDLSGGHDRQPVAQILELTDVAGEVERLQGLERRVGEALRLDAEFLGALGEEMAGQQRNVLAPLAQRRQAQADHVEAVEQIFPEQALAHPLLEVLVRRGDDADAGTNRLMAADPVEMAVGEDAQQPRLQFRWHIADLVEEQRAAFGLLETAAPLRVGAGEGASFVAEQFGLEQVAGNRRGVDGDEWRVAARAVPMQGARDEFLAGARVAVDQHRRMRLRETPDGAEHFLHRRCLAEDFRGHAGRFSRTVAVFALFEGPPHQIDRLVDVEGLGQVLEGAALKRGHSRIEIGIGGHDDDQEVRVFGLYRAQQVETALPGHANVGNEHPRSLAGTQCGQRLVGGTETAEGDVLAGER